VVLDRFMWSFLLACWFFSVNRNRQAMRAEFSAPLLVGGAEKFRAGLPAGA
jgi:hypothetical protein